MVPSLGSLIISGKVPLRSSPTPRHVQSNDPEAIDGYIVAYYYAALTNVLCHAYLVPSEEVVANHVLQEIIDASYSHFRALDNWLAAVDLEEVQKSPNSNLLQEARELWRPWVADWSMIAQRRPTAAPGGGP
jgi:hypothetical protein